MDLEKAKKMFNACLNYAAEGCYQASERQFYLTMDMFISSVASEKEISLERAEEYRQIARVIKGK
jgi:hypothetical protein